ncbi:hypothetical protein [Actinokineospora globicatena]|nr:hypothetical protein [Actinokineospora globicatena]
MDVKRRTLAVLRGVWRAGPAVRPEGDVPAVASAAGVANPEVPGRAVA